MYFRATTKEGKFYDFTSSSTDLNGFKAELAGENIGYVTTSDGTMPEIVGIDIVRGSIITVSPPPLNSTSSSGGFET